MAQRIKDLPSPASHLLFGHLPSVQREGLQFFQRCRDDFGPVTRLRFGPHQILLVCDPDLIAEVMVERHSDYTKHAFFWHHVQAIFDGGLFTANDETWKSQRRNIGPAFSAKRIAMNAEAMVACAEAAMAKWENGQILDIRDEMARLTIDIATRVLLGVDRQSTLQQTQEAFDDISDEIARRFHRPFALPDFLPLPGNRRYRQGLAVLDQLIYGAVADRRQERDSSDRGDLLSLLLEAKDETGAALSDRQLRDQALTLFLAGYETTALVLAWTWFLLSANPDQEAKLLAEFDQVLAGRNPTMADLENLPFAQQVISESMRLLPPVYAMGRQARADTQIGDIAIPTGTNVLINQWIMHRAEAYHPCPHAFQPDRWGDDKQKDLPRFAYFPFSGGPRLCIGHRFAMTEVLLVLTTIAQKYRVRAVDPNAVRIFPTITLRAADGIKACLERRT